MALLVSEINGEIRFLLSGISVAIITDEVLDKIIQRKIDYYGDLDENLCIVTYNSLLDALQYIIVGQVTNGNGITSNNIKKIREKIGKREIEKEAFEGNSSELNTYEKLYDKFLNDPSLVCPSLVDNTKDKSIVLIGGVSQKEFDRVKTNIDSRNGWSMIPKCGRRDGFRSRN